MAWQKTHLPIRTHSLKNSYASSSTDVIKNLAFWTILHYVAPASTSRLTFSLTLVFKMLNAIAFYPFEPSYSNRIPSASSNSIVAADELYPT